MNPVAVVKLEPDLKRRLLAAPPWKVLEVEVVTLPKTEPVAA